ncbi:MAG: hypothetical protein AAGA48_15845 [Myxococcota bacterium]
MAIGVGFLAWASIAQAADCDTALQDARSADRAKAYEDLRELAEKAVACDADDPVAHALLAKAAEYEGDWEAQRVAASVGERLGTSPAVTSRFAQSRRRAETLVALDQGDPVVARQHLDEVRQALPDGDVDGAQWTDDRQAEIQALEQVMAGETCTLVPTPSPAPTASAALLGTQRRRALYAAWCQATRGLVTADLNAVEQAYAEALNAPLPNVADVLPKQRAVVVANQTGRREDAVAALDALAAYPNYPGMASFIARQRDALPPEPPSKTRKSPVGPIVAVAGGVTALVGGGLYLVGRQEVANLVEGPECTELSGGVICTDVGNPMLVEARDRQVLGRTVAAVGGVIAATGLGIRFFSGSKAQAEVSALPGGARLTVTW